MQMHEHWCDQWINVRLTFPKIKLDAEAPVLSF